MKLFNYSTFILGLLLSYGSEFTHATKLGDDEAMRMLLKEFGGQNHKESVCNSRACGCTTCGPDATQVVVAAKVT